MKLSNLPVQSMNFWLLATVTVLSPLLILPLTTSFLLDSKFFVIFAAGLLTFFLWAVATFTKKSIQVTISPFLAPLLLFGGVVLVSSLMNSAYPINQLLGWGGVFLSFISIVLFGSSLLTERKSSQLLNILLIPAVVLSACSFAELTGFGPSRVFNMFLHTSFPSSPLFSLSGSPIITAEFLFVVLVGIVGFLYFGHKKITFFHLITALIVTAGLVVNGYSVYQLQKTSGIFLPYGASWNIMIEGFKAVKPALIGFGPNNYGNVFYAFKPVDLNTTSIWSVPFTQASNFFFTLTSTLGLCGLATWLMLVFQAGKKWTTRNSASTAAAALFFGCIAVELVLPINVVILMVQALALVFWIAAEKNVLKDIQLHAFTVQLIKAGQETQRVPKHTHLIVYLVTLVNAILLALTGYWIGRNTLAQYYDFRSSLAASQNNALDLYTFQQKVIQFNPYNDLYRRNYSVTNITIASAIASNNAAQKDHKLSDTDKQKVVALVQQAIQEAKLATQLDPSNTLNWFNLGKVYSNLIGVADQADQWSIAAYQQAKAISPNDPGINLELGNIYYATGKYDQAQQVYTQLIDLKPDWAMAYYVLAHTLIQRKQLPEAVTAYQQTLSLIGSTTNSQEYAQVKKEMDETQALIKKEKSAALPSTEQKSTLGPELNATSSSSLKKAKDLLNTPGLNQ